MWPEWFELTDDDKLAQAQALTALTGGGLMSTETAVKDVAEVYDVGDVEAELGKIKKDAADADQREGDKAERQAQIDKKYAPTSGLVPQ